MQQTEIRIENARSHNLRGVNCSIPLGSLTVVTGVSGSGKSSLAFDTLYAEGQRRYVVSLSTYARQFLERLPRPEVDRISSLPPRRVSWGPGFWILPIKSSRSASKPSTSMLTVL